MNKSELRKLIYRAAKDLTEPYKNAADEQIFANVCSLDEYKKAETVFCFVGIKDEINTSVLIRQMLSEGKTVCVPKCTDPGIMQAHKISSIEELTDGRFGIPEPSEESPLIEPEGIDFALIPCVTCNKRGQRLGHGGGYYDRYFQDLDIPAAVICREETMTAAVPSESHDISFKIVINERKIYRNN